MKRFHGMGLPRNFSWFVSWLLFIPVLSLTPFLFLCFLFLSQIFNNFRLEPGKLAGCGAPKSVEQLRALAEEGVGWTLPQSVEQLRDLADEGVSWPLLSLLNTGPSESGSEKFEK